MKIQITVCELWHDGQIWSENMPYRQIDVNVPENATDLAISRAILTAVGYGGENFRKDGWCQSDFGPWRRGGIGIYADIVDESVHA